MHTNKMSFFYFQEVEIPEEKAKNKFQGDAKSAKSDFVEKEVFEKLKSYLEESPDVTLMLHDIVLPKGKQQQEIDFLVVNFSHQYLLNIEVKTSLMPKENKKGKSSTKDAKLQLSRIRELLNDFFGSDLKGQWKTISMVCCQKEMEETVEKCEHCQKFVVKPSGIHQKLQSIEESLKTNEQEKYPQDFQEIAKALIFGLPKVALPVTGVYHKFVCKAVTEEAGSAENIRIWAFPTPQQRRLLKEPKVVFAAPWGAGKTILMVEETSDIASRGEKVLFLIFNPSN